MRRLPKLVLEAEAEFGEAGIGGEEAFDLGFADGQDLRAHPRAGLAERGTEIGRFLRTLLVGGDAQILVPLEARIGIETIDLDADARAELERGLERGGALAELAAIGGELRQACGDGGTLGLPGGIGGIKIGEIPGGRRCRHVGCCCGAAGYGQRTDRGRRHHGIAAGEFGHSETSSKRNHRPLWGR